MATELVGSAAELITAASGVKAILDATGAGIGVLYTGDEGDPERWAVAVVIGGENVDALSAWRDALAAAADAA